MVHCVCHWCLVIQAIRQRTACYCVRFILVCFSNWCISSAWLLHHLERFINVTCIVVNLCYIQHWMIALCCSYREWWHGWWRLCKSDRGHSRSFWSRRLGPRLHQSVATAAVCPCSRVCLCPYINSFHVSPLLLTIICDVSWPIDVSCSTTSVSIKPVSGGEWNDRYCWVYTSSSIFCLGTSFSLSVEFWAEPLNFLFCHENERSCGIHLFSQKSSEKHFKTAAFIQPFNTSNFLEN